MPLKLVKRHGSDSWYIRGTVRGVIVDESTKVADKALAEAVRAKREWEIVTRQIGGNRAVATFLEAAVSYLENGGEARYVKPLIDYLKTTPLAQIGQAEVETCARRLAGGCASSTVNRRIFTPMSAIMTHAAKRRLCDKPAFERPAPPRGRVRWITFEEADRLVASCAPHLAPLVTFMLFTGCRIGEALALDWRDVDLSRAHASFLDTKNGDRRGTHRCTPAPSRRWPKFPTEPEQYSAAPTSGPTRPKARAAGRSSGPSQAPAGDRASMISIHMTADTHGLRGTAANRDLGALMALGGWRTVAMVMRYAHVNASNLAPGVMRLGENPGTLESGESVSLRKQGESA